jgi:S-DNA-T family DNA segregation ATPase FtsK/SpoIIIE
MARSRKIKRSRKSKTLSSFLPQALQVFIARRLVDLVALGVLAGGGFALATLLSYDKADPSWNTASDITIENIKNVGGESGAFIADIMLQTLGLAAFIPALVLLIWGVRIFKRQSIRPLTLRAASTLLASLFGAVAFVHAPAWMSGMAYGIDSAAGILALEFLNSFFEGMPHAGFALRAMGGCLALGFLLYGAAVRTYEIASVWFRFKVVIYSVLVAILSLAHGFYGWIKRYNSPEYAPEPNSIGIVGKLQAMKEERARMLQDREEAWKEEQAEIAKTRMERSAPIRLPKKVVKMVESVEPVRAEPSQLSGSIPVVKPQSAAQKVAGKNAKDSSQQRFSLVDGDGEWELPSVNMIQEVPPEVIGSQLNEEALRRNAELLRNVLEDFNIRGDIVSIHPGPVVTLYELEPAPGTKTSRVISLSDDIARSMSAISVRCAVVPGRNVIGIELPNKTRQVVYMKEMLLSRIYEKTSAKLPLVLGKDIGGQPVLADLSKMPHLLVAGTTGAGKSVAINTMIMSLLYRLSPEKCRFIMIDPKMLELSVYADIPHLLSPVVTEPGKAVVALKWAVHEMENRYRNMSKLGVRNIEGYNQRIRTALKKGEQIMHKVQTGFDPENGKAVFEDRELVLEELPYIVIVVDEFADLMLVAGKDVENAIQRLAQMARAAGLHLIMATQRPSVDVITGVVKANFPTRISFQVTSKIDSRTILGDSGAEQLLGMGDMLYMAPGGRITRVHGPFVTDEDVEKVANFLRSQGTPAYLDDVTSDEGSFGGSEVMNAMFGDSSNGDDQIDDLYDKAVAIITREGKVSTSFIQRHLQIGYNRAARIVEEMERQGVISTANSAGRRQILVSDHSNV